MIHNLLVLIVWLVLPLRLVCNDCSKSITSLIPSKHYSERFLHILTCDTRRSIKGKYAIDLWNKSAQYLHSSNINGEESLRLINVCHGVRWKTFGFLTKLMKYHQYITDILNTTRSSIQSKPRSGPTVPSQKLQYVLLMDSDTFFSVNSLAYLWKVFDCIRGTKGLVMSTEMQCWLGRFCTPTDLHMYYPRADVSSSHSIFINSGVLLGNITSVHKLLTHILTYNASYYVRFVGRRWTGYKFDDQYAFTHYAIHIAPDEVALDYSQHLVASFPMHTGRQPYYEVGPEGLTHNDTSITPGIRTNTKSYVDGVNVINNNVKDPTSPNAWIPRADSRRDVVSSDPVRDRPTFVCKSGPRTFSLNCSDDTADVSLLDVFQLDPSTCLLHRRTSPNSYTDRSRSVLSMPHVASMSPRSYNYDNILRHLATEPVIWHGNGVGKRLFSNYSDAVMRCYITREARVIQPLV